MSITTKTAADHQNLAEPKAVRSALDQLFSSSRLYTKSKDYQDLLSFVVRLRNFAPFNAMLLQIQKPGLSYAASALDWYNRFERTIKEGARPLLILWPFGPVALVYDVQDTEGKDLPEDVMFFYAHGQIDENKIALFRTLMHNMAIECLFVDLGDRKAGKIEIIKRASGKKKYTVYRIQVNRNHALPTQFTTLAHELGHLFLGHLGQDKMLKVPNRDNMILAQEELEAESVAFLVGARNGVISKSEAYLSQFINENTSSEHVDVYQVMRAAGQIESLLGLKTETESEKPFDGNQFEKQTDLFEGAYI